MEFQTVRPEEAGTAVPKGDDSAFHVRRRMA